MRRADSLLAIALFLLAAFLWFSGSPAQTSGTPTNLIEQELSANLPDADPLTLRRVACRFGPDALQIVDGEAGLWCLDEFGDLALGMSADRLDVLSSLRDLPVAQRRLVLDPWRIYAVDCAHDGSLPRFRVALSGMSSAEVAVAAKVPAALPLLVTKPADRIVQVLDRYETRAWRLLAPLDFVNHPEDAVRVANAIDLHGELLFELHESYGLAFVWMLVGKPADSTERQIAELLVHAINELDDRRTAFALILSNFDSLERNLRRDRSVADFQAAITDFATLHKQPRAMELSAEYPQLLRLLSESWHDQRIGLQVLEKCGPAGAEMVYELYDQDPKLRTAALVSLAHLGPPAMRVFHELGRDERFRDLLRRAESEGLLRPDESPPYLVYGVHKLSQSDAPETLLDDYQSNRRLRDQIDRDAFPVPEGFVWVPGSLAYRTYSDYSRGYRVTRGDAFWAVIDAGEVVLTVVTLGGAAANVGVREAAKTGFRKGSRRLAVGLQADPPNKEILDDAFDAVWNPGEELAPGGEPPISPGAGGIWSGRLETTGNMLGSLRDNRERVTGFIMSYLGGAKSAEHPFADVVANAMKDVSTSELLALLEETNRETTYGRSLTQSREMAARCDLAMWPTAGCLEEKTLPWRMAVRSPRNQFVFVPGPGDFEAALMDEVLR